MSRRNQTIINEEVTFSDDEELVSVTDTRGVIRYANKEFCRVAGFSKEELVGKNHNIIRHPDMPKAAFADMWSKLNSGQAWRGAVKNRCKDGRYYWVDAFVTPLYEAGKLTGFQSVRTTLPSTVRNRAFGNRQRKNRRVHWLLCDKSTEWRQDSYLRRRLRPIKLWHRCRYGRASARPA